MKVMGIIFSNIYDSSLGELTNHRTVASLPFGGRYRQPIMARGRMFRTVLLLMDARSAEL